jgi:response regulator RpfG family c-di-GMP phosphodiesterase
MSGLIETCYLSTTALLDLFMNQRRVLDVGNCGPDHASIRRMLTTNFGAEVIQTHGLDDTLAELQKNSADLVLINRKLDQDYSDGIVILEHIKSKPEHAELPVMLITNYAEYQANAVALGALPGFGKLEINSPETRAKLASVLQPS